MVTIFASDQETTRKRLENDLKTTRKRPESDLKTDLKNLSIEDQILHHIQVNNQISIAGLAQLIGLGNTKTKEYLQQLKNSGILKRVGPPKGGHWEITLISETVWQ